MLSVKHEQPYKIFGKMIIEVRNYKDYKTAQIFDASF